MPIKRNKRRQGENNNRPSKKFKIRIGTRGESIRDIEIITVTTKDKKPNKLDEEKNVEYSKNKVSEEK